MAFPMPTNTTCDVYHSGNAPPNPPDVTGVKGNLVLRARNIKSDKVYTHWIDVPLGTDVRISDTFYVPNQNGTAFTWIGLVRIRSGSGNDYKRVYLKRNAVTWPSQNL